MFELNDVLVYGNNGICRIADIRKERFTATKEEMYYILSPVFGKQSKLYVPMQNIKLVEKLRPVMYKDDLTSMLSAAKQVNVKWNSDDRIRDEEFHSTVAKGLSTELLVLIKNILFHKIELKDKIKKLHASDERMLALSEKIAGEEFAYVMGMDVSEAVAFLENELTAA